MCQLTSPSSKIILELPSAKGRRSTPTSTGSKSLPGPAAWGTSTISSPPVAATCLSTRTGARPLRRPSAIDEVEHHPDRLRGEEEDLSTIGQANEEIKAAKNS